MSREEVIRCEEHDRLHTAWMEDEPKRWREAQRDDLGGRISGPEDWRAARDELGGEEEIHKPAMSSRLFFIVGFHIEHSCPYNSQWAESRYPDHAGQSRVPFRWYNPYLTSGSSLCHLFTSSSFAIHVIPSRDVFPSHSPVGQRWCRRDSTGLHVRACTGRRGIWSRLHSVTGPSRRFCCRRYVIDGACNDRSVDTFRSYDFAADPITPHISVHSPPHAHHRNSIVCTKPSTLPPLNDGKVYTLELVYQARDRSLTGWIRVESEEMVLWRTTIPCGDKVESNRSWHVGVTGSTGGLWQKASETIRLYCTPWSLMYSKKS